MKIIILIALLATNLCFAADIETPITIVTLKDGTVVKSKIYKEENGKVELQTLGGIKMFVPQSDIVAIKESTAMVPNAATKEIERREAAKEFWRAKLEKEKQAEAKAAAIQPFQKETKLTSGELQKTKAALDEKRAKQNLSATMLRDIPAKIDELKVRIREAEIKLKQAQPGMSVAAKNILDDLVAAKTEQEQLFKFATDAKPQLDIEVATLAALVAELQAAADEANVKLRAAQEDQNSKAANP